MCSAAWSGLPDRAVLDAHGRGPDDDADRAAGDRGEPGETGEGEAGDAGDELDDDGEARPPRWIN